MELTKTVLMATLLFGPVLTMVFLLNWRDYRVSQLRHIVVDQLGLHDLRGRIAVHIRCGLLSGRSTVAVDLLASTPYEIWDTFTRVAAHLPPRVHFLVRGMVDGRGTQLFTLNTTTIRLPSRTPSTLLAPG